MYRIDDNADESVQNVGTTWDETGVTAEDAFKIGQNTRQVLADIQTHSGIDFYVPGITVSEDQTDTTIVPNGDAGTNEWTDVAAPHWSKIDEGLVIDGTAISASDDDDDLIEIFTMTTKDIGNIGIVTAATVYLYCKEDPYTDPYAIDVYLSWDGGSTWSSKKFVSPIGSYSWLNTGAWTGLTYNQAHLDQLQVKIDASDITAGHTKYVDSLYVSITYDAISHPFTKYMAREFKGNYCIEALKALCQLEGCHWAEDYSNNRIIVSTPANFEDSGVDLTEADYDFDWEYEDGCNNFYRIEVYGQASNEIYGFAEDISIDSPMTKIIIDDSITNNADAQEIADTQLALLQTKLPAIKISLNGTNAGLVVGKDVDITFVRPTIAEVAYPIRTIKRIKRGIDGMKTIISVGLGRTAPMEFLARTIRDIGYLTHKIQTEKLL